MRTLISFIRQAGILLAMAASLSAAADAAYPNKPVTLVVPHPAGGYTDLVARLIAQGLSEKWKSAVIVENRAGAGGSIGTAYAARREPDGYTLFLSSTGTDVINPLIYKKLEVDAATALAPVILATKMPNVIVVGKSLDIHSVADLIAYAKSHPGKLNFGNPGAGTNSHFTGAMFSALNGLKLTEIPYKGSAAVLTDVVNGNLDAAVDNIVFWAPQVKGQAVRAIAVTSLRRSPLLPDVPTLAESGMPGFEATTFTGISVPQRTPAAIIERLNRDIQEVLASDTFRQKIGPAEIVGGSVQDFRHFLSSERAKLGKAAVDLNIRLD